LLGCSSSILQNITYDMIPFLATNVIFC
jgi:hypothetical protein